MGFSILSGKRTFFVSEKKITDCFLHIGKDCAMGLFNSSDIGLDLGTSNILAYIRGKGIVLREPCIAAIERGTGKMIAIGQEAKDMVGRAPDNLMIIRPMQDGVIANFDATERMLTMLFNRIVGNRIFFKPRAVVATFAI